MTKRLLKLAEAATYCGVSPAAFTRWCQVRPISLAPAGVVDKRLRRWDVNALDAWIDTLGALPKATSVDWAKTVFNDARAEGQGIKALLRA